MTERTGASGTTDSPAQGRYVEATTIETATSVNSLANTGSVRAVVTKRNHGVVELRYVPQEPRTESPDTST